jgi:hypothetical protein
MSSFLHRLIETRFTTALELPLLPLIDLDRYAKKRPKDSPGQQTFRWVTIGAEEGPDGEKHGGHPVLIDNDGRMQSGKFAGQTFDQAFGDKAKSSGENESKPQESPPEPPQESPPKHPEAPQAESKPVEPPPAPAQPPAPAPKPLEPPQTKSTANEGVELPSGPDATPRDRASAADQANQQQYAGARASAVSNIGEDILGSARHRALLWRGLEAAEQDGSAAEAITRDQLLKHEPHSLMTSVDTNPLASLAMYHALRKFPAKPGTRSSASPESLAKDRKQFYQAYVDIKNFAEQIARETPDHEAMRSISELNQFVVSRIEQLRREDRYNQTANDLIALHKALRGGYHSQKSGVISQLNEFAKALTNLPRDESDDDEADASVTRAQYAQAATYAAKIIDGESLNSAFGKTSTASTPRFNPADSYVKVAERQGGKDLQGVTKSPQAALQYAVEQLKLRGVQWGNYVTDEERMHHAAKSVEALVDLADVLGIKPEDISLGGQLGLAIGARGTGNALAHYEPELKVINLTRAGGVGSLAHEWGHALDHSLTDFSKGFMSDEYRFTHQSLQNGRVWRMEEKDATASSRLNPEELSNIEIRRAYRAFFESPEYQQYYRRVREHVQDLVRNKQVSIKKANEYWLSRKEIFARTFERYVQRKLETSGRKNTYLAGIEKNAYQQGGLWPTDQEADSLMAGLDGIFSAYRQSRYGSADRQQYSRRSARAIIERMLTAAFVLDHYTAKKNDSDSQKWITIGGKPNPDKGTRHSGGKAVLIDEEGVIQGGNVPKDWQGKHITSAHQAIPSAKVPTSLPDFIDPDDIDDDDRQTSTGDDDDISFDPEDFDSAISFDPSEFEDSITSTGAMPASDFIGNPRLKSRFDEMGLSIDQLNQRLGLNIQPQQPSKPNPDLNAHTFDAAAHSTITPMAFEITSNPRMQNRFKDLTLEEFNRRMGLTVKRPEVAPDSISFVPPEPSKPPEAVETTPAARATKPRGPFRPRNRVDHAIVDTVGDDPERVADFRNILDNVYQLRLQRDEARSDAIRSLFSSYGISSQRIGSLISLLGRQDYDKIPRWGEMVRTASSSPQYAVLFDHAGGESDKRDDDESKLAVSIAEGFSITPPKYSREILDAAKELARNQGFFHAPSATFPESSSWDSSIPDYFSLHRSQFRRAIIERYFDYVELLRAS